MDVRGAAMSSAAADGARRLFSACVMAAAVALSVSDSSPAGGDPATAPIAGAAHPVPDAGAPSTRRALLARLRLDESRVLRVRFDALRGRIWALGVEDVSVYDARRAVLIHRMAMPNWSVAGHGICPPDLVLDGRGAAYVSSNVQPRLLRVDPDSFRAAELEIRLLARERWETGFGALAVSRDGVLFGMASPSRSLWTIDPDKREARELAPPASMPHGCELAPQG